MPHLNSRPFTEERLESILQQTLREWELIVVDSKSDDGSREVLNAYAKADSRIRIVEGPRDGIYANLNRAVELSAGDYIYIATSDDTMAPECLTLMVEALRKNPDCGICHCCLEIIDDIGKPIETAEAWDRWPAQDYFGEWLHTYHVRRAPHDGLLHLGLYAVYASLTQLLIRRRVFEQLGLFITDCGSHADFEWGMRVGLNENVVHVPKKLATWRRHSLQATQPSTFLHIRAKGEFRRLVRKALESFSNRNPKLAKALRRSNLNHFYLASELEARRQASNSPLAELNGFMVFVIKHPFFSVRWFFRKVILRKRITGEFADAVRAEFTRLGLTNLLSRLDPC